MADLAAGRPKLERVVDSEGLWPQVAVDWLCVAVWTLVLAYTAAFWGGVFLMLELT
jgi:hypothetical protein